MSHMTSSLKMETGKFELAKYFGCPLVLFLLHSVLRFMVMSVVEKKETVVGKIGVAHFSHHSLNKLFSTQLYCLQMNVYICIKTYGLLAIIPQQYNHILLNILLEDSRGGFGSVLISKFTSRILIVNI